jgi:hypothetical protein
LGSGWNYVTTVKKWLRHFLTVVTWNSDDEPLAASVTGQPRGDCPYLNNSCFVGAVPQGKPQTFEIAGILSAKGALHHTTFDANIFHFLVHLAYLAFPSRYLLAIDDKQLLVQEVEGHG